MASVIFFSFFFYVCVCVCLTSRIENDGGPSGFRRWRIRCSINQRDEREGRPAHVHRSSFIYVNEQQIAVGMFAVYPKTDTLKIPIFLLRFLLHPSHISPVVLRLPESVDEDLPAPMVGDDATDVDEIEFQHENHSPVSKNDPRPNARADVRKSQSPSTDGFDNAAFEGRRPLLNFFLSKIEKKSN